MEELEDAEVAATITVDNAVREILCDEVTFETRTA